MSAELTDVLVRLQRLEDREAIRDTWLDYCNRLDTEDFAGLGDVFTEDAELELHGLAPTLDGTYQGRQSIIEDCYARMEVPPSADAPARFMTGHLSTNMQIELLGDEATTLAYFFEIVDDNLILIGTYQHRLRRDPDRWRFLSLRISIRYRARIEASSVRGQSLQEILGRPL